MEIKNFYKGKTIFLTGTTGFVGKVVLEKIMRQTEYKKLYLMVRSKKNQSVQ
jgi:fatty acyl-CoA reductase